MSFDTTFDYTTIVANVTTKKDSAQSKIDTASTELALLNASPYVELCASKIADLNQIIDFNTKLTTAAQLVLNEITSIQALTQPEKEKLFYIYTILESVVDIREFMKKMLFNYPSAIASTQIQGLIDDAVTPIETKHIIAKIVYDTYQLGDGEISSIRILCSA